MHVNALQLGTKLRKTEFCRLPASLFFCEFLQHIVRLEHETNTNGLGMKNCIFLPQHILLKLRHVGEMSPGPLSVPCAGCKQNS